VSKVTEQFNWRVVCEPKQLFNIGEASEREANDLADDIRKHIPDAAHIRVLCDAEDRCSHCWVTWSADSHGQPSCCTAAQLEWAREDAARSEVPA